MGVWPKRVLQINWQAVAHHLKLSNSDKVLVTKLLNIDSEEAVALVTDWSPVNVSPAKHNAYAMQWFAMSVALLILYGWYLRTESRQDDQSMAKKLKMKADDN